MKWHGVTWNNIDWNEKTVKIDKAYTRVKKTEYKDREIVTAGSKKDFKDLKTKSSYRTIGLNDAMINILKQHKEEQKELAKANNKQFKETDWVFTTKVYTGMLHDYIDDKFRKVMNETKILGYKEITPHCLRHTYCTMGIENGTRVEEMRDVLGHSNIAVTANWYTHLDKNAVVKASNKVNGALENYMKDK